MAEDRAVWKSIDTRPRQWCNELPGAKGIIQLSFRQDGVLLFEGEGFWSTLQVADFLDEHLKVLAQMRRSAIPLRGLIDLRQSGVQASDIMRRFQDSFSHYRAGDRVAIVVVASLLKLQSQRVVDTEMFTHFNTIEEAEAWLKTG